MKISLFFLTLLILAVGCAPQRKTFSYLKPPPPIEEYVEKPISISRYFKYLEYKRKLLPALPDSPKVIPTPQTILENTCGPCVIKSVGDFFGTIWPFDEIRRSVLGTHEQGTSVSAIAKWFTEKGYTTVDLRRGDRDFSSLACALDEGCLIIALIYSFRDGYGPNHFVIVSCHSDQLVNVVDSRIGTYSEPADFFMGRQVLVQGTWIAIKP
ncbi:MAG: hypothetical protein Kow00107_07440 [Planctomycetota bacterium]